MTLRVAVVGAGVMGRNHARVLGDLAGARLAAVADADEKAAAALADAHGVPARTLEAALADAEIDALVVATPTRTHRDVAVAALRAGKHVLVEKPLAASIPEAEEIVRVARETGRTLAVGHIERHNPAVRYVKEALERGEYGKLITVTARRVSNFPGRIRDVGVILDLGIHDIDAVRYLAGAEPVRVHAAAGTFMPGVAFEDHAAVLLAFPNGVSGVVETNWLTPMKVRRLAITASEAYVEVDYITQSVRISTSRFATLNEANLFQVPLELSERTVTLRRQEPLKLELADFVEAAATGRAPLVTGEDGVAALRIAEAAVASARSGEARGL